MKQLTRLTLVPTLVLLTACGDDGGATDTPMDEDMGLVALDMSTPAEDMGTDDTDAFVPPACDPDTCENGTCDGDVCECELGWTGDLCDAPNEPLEDGIVFWFDADAMDTFTLEGDVVDDWSSRVGTMTSAAQSGEEPRLLTAGATFANGRPTVTFDGSDDQMLAVWSAGGATEYTAFLVFNVLGGNQTVMDVNTQTADNVLRVRLGGPVSPYQLQATAEDGATNEQSVLVTSDDAPTGEMIVMAVRVSDTEVALWRDGSEAMATALTTPLYEGISSPFVTFGSTDASAAASEYYGGSLAEVIVFDSAVTDGVLQAVSAYLDAKWR